MDQQHAPSPDYSSEPTVELHRVTIQCRDCGDTEEQFVPFEQIMERIRRQRCDECQAEHDSEKRARMRATVGEALRRAFVGKTLVVEKPMTAIDQPVPQLVTTKGEWRGHPTGQLIHGRWERIRDMEPMRQPEQVDVMCDECAECVTSVVGPVDHLDGKAMQCPRCDTFGKIIVGDDEGSAHVRFRAYTAKEIASQ